MATSAGTVVVIDDEQPIRDYLAGVLRNEGYECKCFQESLAALAYLSHAEVPPDLIMTDLLLPGVNGLEVVRQVHALSPDLPVVLLSGVYELGVALEDGASDTPEAWVRSLTAAARWLVSRQHSATRRTCLA